MRKKSNDEFSKMNTGQTVLTAILIVIVLILGMILGVWITSDGVYGGETFLNRCINVIMPEEDTTDGTLDTNYEITIENENEVDAALDKLEVAHKPGYIPSDCEFDCVTILYDEDCFGTAADPSPYTAVVYYYNRGDDVYYVSFDYYQSESVSTNVVGRLYKSPKTGQEMYIAEFEEEGQFSVISINDTYDCCVMGRGTVEDGIKTMESIYQYK